MAIKNDYGMGIYAPENKMNKENKDLINDSGLLYKETVENEMYMILSILCNKMPGDIEINKLN